MSEQDIILLKNRLHSLERAYYASGSRNDNLAAVIVSLFDVVGEPSEIKKRQQCFVEHGHDDYLAYETD
jgi:hypothetical protein